MKKIRFAVIGCGHVGLRHAEMIHRNPEAELAAVCDIFPEPPAAISEWNIPYFDSAEKMLDTITDVDVVNVCTPNGLHAKHSLMALERKKHVVLEKPMALSKADCEKVIFKALQVHRNVFC